MFVLNEILCEKKILLATECSYSCTNESCIIVIVWSSVSLRWPIEFGLLLWRASSSVALVCVNSFTLTILRYIFISFGKLLSLLILYKILNICVTRELLIRKVLTIPYLKPYGHPRHEVKHDGDVLVSQGQYGYMVNMYYLKDIFSTPRHIFKKSLFYVQGAPFKKKIVKLIVRGSWV